MRVPERASGDVPQSKRVTERLKTATNRLPTRKVVTGSDEDPSQHLAPTPSHNRRLMTTQSRYPTEDRDTPSTAPTWAE